MSWDLYVADIPSSWRTTNEVPEDWKPLSIGTRTELIARIKQIVPRANFSDPSWGHIDGPGYSIEISLSEKDTPLSMLALFIRGGDEAAYIAADLISRLGLRAFDTGSPDATIFPGPDVTEGLRQWRKYRDQLPGVQQGSEG